MRGRFITFEGIEGSGKSSQIALLAGYLRSKQRIVSLTREPGGTTIGDQVRKILLDPANKALDPAAELLLYAASRAQHLTEVIGPALERGAVVLCDRFSDATIAYQGYGRGLDRDMIDRLDRMVTAGMRPALTLLLDVDVAVGLARARGRNDLEGLEAEARFENENLKFHDRVRRGYLALAKEEPSRISIVDAALTPDRVQEKIREIVNRLLEPES